MRRADKSAPFAFLELAFAKDGTKMCEEVRKEDLQAQTSTGQDGAGGA